MKRKLYFATMLCLMMFMGMAATAQTQLHQRACNVVKMELCKQNGVISSIEDAANECASKQASESYKSESDEPNDLAVVTFKNNIQEFNRYLIANIMVYNSDWSQLLSLYGNDEFVVEVPCGTYDIQTNTFDIEDNGSSSKLLVHIDELITINKDTTITLDVTNAPNLCSFDLYDESGELLQLDTYNGIWEMIGEGNIQGINGVEWIWLEDYGPTNNIYVMGDAQVEGLLRPGEFSSMT